MKLYNSLSRSVEEFKPLNPSRVGMYSCGPTVYDFPHIGNWRTFILSDILYRTLKVDKFEVKSVMNITDVDDKIIKGAKEKNLTLEEFTREYANYFFKDLNKLNITPADEYPKATDHIEKMVKFIEVLINKGVAYVKDGSVYFEVSKFSNYGKLSGLDKRELKTGTRILSDEYSKDNPSDFALWKAVDTAEIGWDSPWGKGRPGWHIECSVMSSEYLGESFDIHVGGIDLMFPHHENEIAQSEGKSGKEFVKYFIHGEHILVDGEKMSKSKNNFYTLADLEEKGFEPLVLRYLYLTSHYRDKLNFTWNSLSAAKKALENLRQMIRDWEKPGIGCAGYEQDFKNALNNDLNTSQALAIMWELVKNDDYPTSAKAASLLKMDEVLGLRLSDYIGNKIQIPVEIQDLIEKRENARRKGDFEESDQLRDQIKKLGFDIEDTQSGPKIKV